MLKLATEFCKETAAHTESIPRTMLAVSKALADQ